MFGTFILEILKNAVHFLGFVPTCVLPSKWRRMYRMDYFAKVEGKTIGFSSLPF